MENSNSKMTIKLIWGIVMVIAYLGISYLVVFTPVLIRYNSTNNSPSNDENFIFRIILGIILFVYGLFRGYRIWRMNN